MVDQAASKPQSGNAGATAPFMRVDLREETVTERGTPGGAFNILHPQRMLTCLLAPFYRRPKKNWIRTSMQVSLVSRSLRPTATYVKHLMS